MSQRVKLQSINGLILWFWRVQKHLIHQWIVHGFLAGQGKYSIHQWTGVWFLASIQSISGLYMYANDFCHNPSVDCAQTIFVEMSICNPLMDCSFSFFCQIRGKNTPLNSNDLNLFFPFIFPFFYFTCIVTSFVIFSRIRKKITICQSISGLILWEGADSRDGSNSHLKICFVPGRFKNDALTDHWDIYPLRLG